MGSPGGAFAAVPPRRRRAVAAPPPPFPLSTPLTKVERWEPRYFRAAGIGLEAAGQVRASHAGPAERRDDWLYLRRLAREEFLRSWVLSFLPSPPYYFPSPLSPLFFSRLVQLYPYGPLSPHISSSRLPTVLAPFRSSPLPSIHLSPCHHLHHSLTSPPPPATNGKFHTDTSRSQPSGGVDSALYPTRCQVRPNDLHNVDYPPTRWP